ncbi:MAG TPA: hypothetical protein VKO18_16325 [Terriglobia bacterium]|nr:hypothetical protein [Terriglobia bacterium]
MNIVPYRREKAEWAYNGCGFRSQEEKPCFNVRCSEGDMPLEESLLANQKKQ